MDTLKKPETVIALLALGISIGDLAYLYKRTTDINNQIEDLRKNVEANTFMLGGANGNLLPAFQTKISTVEQECTTVRTILDGIQRDQKTIFDVLAIVINMLPKPDSPTKDDIKQAKRLHKLMKPHLPKRKRKGKGKGKKSKKDQSSSESDSDSDDSSSSDDAEDPMQIKRK